MEKIPSIVIELSGKSTIIGVYSDDVIQVVLVDHDDENGSASCECVPAPTSEMPKQTRRWAADAIERAR